MQIPSGRLSARRSGRTTALTWRHSGAPPVTSTPSTMRTLCSFRGTPTVRASRCAWRSWLRAGGAVSRRWVFRHAPLAGARLDARRRARGCRRVSAVCRQRGRARRLDRVRADVGRLRRVEVRVRLIFTLWRHSRPFRREYTSALLRLCIAVAAVESNWRDCRASLCKLLVDHSSATVVDWTLLLESDVELAVAIVKQVGLPLVDSAVALA